MTEDRVGDLLSVYLAGREAGAPSAPEELCRDCPELLAELQNRIVAVEKMGRLVAQTTGPLELSPADFPSRLGGYAVLAVLGRGGMGAVLLADDMALGRKVAVKVMLPTVAADPVARERFLREARAAARIQHDHVVPIHHIGEEGGVPYLVMPLLRGESLEARLERESALTPAEVIRIAAEAAEGLAAAHAQNLIHRDVKPANLWLEAPGGRVKVLDFGLARQETVGDSVTRSGTILGTPAYMAPEQVDGLKVDARADLFSLGASLYRAATGCPAFAGKTLTAVLRAVAERHPPPPHEVNPAVPSTLSDLIMRMLAKTPGERPLSARAVADEMIQLANQPTVPLAFPETVAIPASNNRSGTQPRPRPVGPRTIRIGCAVVVSFCLFVGVTLGAVRLIARVLSKGPPSPPAVATQPPAADPPVTRHRPPEVAQEPTSPAALAKAESSPARYRGKVDVLVERVRDGKPRLLRLDEPGALPLTSADRFRIEGEVDPPAYLYLVWVDPNHDVTPVYPWDPEAKRWQGTRPAVEEPTGRVSLPRNKSERWRAPKAKSGVATMVLFARPTPLDAPDEVLEQWFKELPELPLPPGGDGSAVWFDDYAVVKTDPARCAQFVREETNDSFERWQGQLQKSLSGKAQFQTAVSFARTGGK